MYNVNNEKRKKQIIERIELRTKEKKPSGKRELTST